MPQSPMVFVQCSRLLRSFCVIIELCTVRNSHSLNLFWKEIQSIHENVTMPNPHLYFQLSRISFSESRYRKRFFILRRGSFEYGEEIREKMVNTSLALHFPSIRCVVPLTKWSNERTKKKTAGSQFSDYWLLIIPYRQFQHVRLCIHRYSTHLICYFNWRCRVKCFSLIFLFCHLIWYVLFFTLTNIILKTCCVQSMLKSNETMLFVWLTFFFKLFTYVRPFGESCPNCIEFKVFLLMIRVRIKNTFIPFLMPRFAIHFIR